MVSNSADNETLLSVFFLLFFPFLPKSLSFYFFSFKAGPLVTAKEIEGAL